jgi:hypothetical protein
VKSFPDPGQDYLELCLRVERHSPGLVETYFGPPGARQAIEAEDLRPIGELLHDARSLAASLSGLDDPLRRSYLRGQVTALETILRELNGEELSLEDSVEGRHGVRPHRIPDHEFDQVHRRLDGMVPGSGGLASRLGAWRDPLRLDPVEVLPLFRAAVREVRRRTKALLELPRGERVKVQPVHGQAFGANNLYLGQARSLIELSADRAFFGDYLLDYAAHEAYPGHHTEAAIKDTSLHHGRGRLEHSLVQLHSPDATVSEAIATHALDMVFPHPDDWAGWMGEHLNTTAMDRTELARLRFVLQEMRRLQAVVSNAAFMCHVDKLPEEQILDYLRSYALRGQAEAQNVLGFIRAPQYRAYVFTYQYGFSLMEAAIQRAGVGVFMQALYQPLTPRDLERFASADAAAGPGRPDGLGSPPGQPALKV